jgi:putative membrane protein
VSVGSVVPYCGIPPAPAELASAWNVDPPLLAALTFAGLVMLRLPERRRRAGLAGVALLAVIFVSPLCALASALFAARGVHHLALAAVAAPLLAAALPAARRGGVAVPLGLSSLVLWLWHWPALYDAIYREPALYWLMQGLLLASFVGFWRAVISPGTAPVAALLGIGAGAGQMGLLGALLTLAPAPLYPVHGAGALLWGLDPLQDQQLAGLLMWVPAFFVYGGYALMATRRLDRAAFE